MNMSNTKYIRGANFERWLLNKLREQGYDGMRSAGSHSAADLIVWKGNHLLHDAWVVENFNIYAIQCKTSQSDVNLTDLIWKDEVRELTAMPDNFIKVLCIKQNRKITQLVWKDMPTPTISDPNKETFMWWKEDIFKLK